MYIDVETLNKLAIAIGAIVTIGGALYSMFSWYGKQKQVEKDLDEVKTELCILTKGILACLKVMQDKGYGGAVSEFSQDIEKYLNKKAHDVK